MPDPETLSAADFDRVLDLAIELGDLARKVRREREAGKPRPDGVIATWETPTVKIILDDTSPARAWDA